MIQTTNTRRGQLYINWNGFGWVESYDFADITDTDAVTKVQALAALRAFLLPDAATIEYGRIMIPGQPRKSILALPAPIPGNTAGLTTPPDNFINDPEVCLMFRVDGESYSRAVRHIRAVPDGLIQDMTLTAAAPGGAWVTGFGIALPPVAAAATWAAALKLYLTYYVNACTINKKGTIPAVGGGTTSGYNCASMTALTYRKASKVNCGRPFDLPRARRPQR